MNKNKIYNGIINIFKDKLLIINPDIIADFIINYIL